MNNNKIICAKILCICAIFLIFTPSMSAQVDNSKPFTVEQISKARKGFKKWISESNIVALVRVWHYDQNLDCFYGDDGKTIYSAIKFKLIHNYTENMRTVNGEAIVIVEGGIIGTDRQYFGFDLRPGINTVSLLRLDESIENKSSKFNGLPAYKGTSIPMGFQSEDGIPYWKTSAYQFKSTDEFDAFVYKALGRTSIGKKKDVGYSEYLNSPTSMVVTGITYPIGSGGGVHAGTDEVLTIHGTGFPTDKTKVEVLFVNADAPLDYITTPPTTRYFKKLPNSYIKSVSSNGTTIEVYVPSITPNKDGGCAGSGSIKVRNKATMETTPASTQKVNIEYSILNSDIRQNANPQYKFFRERLVQNHCINGFVFTLHTSVRDKYPEAIPAIEKALKEWSDYLSGIENGKEVVLELEKNSDGSLVFVNSPSYLGRNVIYFGAPKIKLIQSNNGEYKAKFTDMRCSSTLREANSNGANLYSYIVKNNIYMSVPFNKTLEGVSVKLEWHFDLGDKVKSGENDFYARLLHELGHAIGIGHDLDLVNGKNNLMDPFFDATGPINAGNRMTLMTAPTTRAKAAADDNILLSRESIPDWIGSNPDENPSYLKPLNSVVTTIVPTPSLYKELIGFEFFKFGSTSSQMSLIEWYEQYDRISEFTSLSIFKHCSDNVSRITARVQSKDCLEGYASLASLPFSPPWYWCSKTLPSLNYIKKVKERGLKPFPNPTNGLVFVELLWDNTLKLDGSVIEVYKDNGNKIIEQNVMITDMIKQFDLSPYQDGTYFVLWMNGNTVYATSEIQLIRN